MDLDQARNNLHDSNTDTVLAALRILGKCGKLADLQPVLALVKSSIPSLQIASVQASSALIKENLITHFHELDQAVREKLGILLHSLDPSVVNEISNDLYSESDERRLRAVQILGLLKKNPQLREILAKLIHNRDVKIRATAVNLLGKAIGPNDHDLILSLLNDKDLRVRANTIEALECLNNKRLVPILLRFRKDTNNRIRGNVIKALFNLGHSEIESDLIDMLNSSNHLMQASAIWVVSKIKFFSKSVEDAVAFCLLSDHEVVNVNARKTLQHLKSPRAEGYLRYLVENQIPSVKVEG
jgi:HEAT repeat protein